MKNNPKRNSNHEADIENANKKTKGKNVTFKKNEENRERQLKEERDKRANENNPNNPNYKGKKSGE